MKLLKSLIFSAAIALALASCGNTEADAFAQRVADGYNSDKPIVTDALTVDSARVDGREIIFPLSLGKITGFTFTEDKVDEQELKKAAMAAAYMEFASDPQAMAELDTLIQYNIKLTYRFIDYEGVSRDYSFEARELKR